MIYLIVGILIVIYLSIALSGMYGFCEYMEKSIAVPVDETTMSIASVCCFFWPITLPILLLFLFFKKHIDRMVSYLIKKDLNERLVDTDK